MMHCIQSELNGVHAKGANGHQSNEYSAPLLTNGLFTNGFGPCNNGNLPSKAIGNGRSHSLTNGITSNGYSNGMSNGLNGFSNGMSNGYHSNGVLPKNGLLKNGINHSEPRLLGLNGFAKTLPQRPHVVNIFVATQYL